MVKIRLSLWLFNGYGFGRVMFSAMVRVIVRVMARIMVMALVRARVPRGL